MLSPKLRADIRKLWDRFWSGGIANPLTAIEQITYLVFLKRLEDLDIDRVQADRAAGRDSRSIYDDGGERFKWSYIKQLPGQERLDHMRRDVFDWLKTIPGAEERMRDAVFVIPSANLLQGAIEIIDELFAPGRYKDQDTLGDIYELLLNEIAESGKNGQFRTPRHIIRAMCDLVNPQIGEQICDPACGTAGFLVNAYQHILKRNTNDESLEFEADGSPLNLYGDLLTAEQHAALRSNHFHGYDFDRTMVRLGWMNMIQHGLAQPNIGYADALGSRFYEQVQRGTLGGYDVVLANPPFTGNLDKNDISPELGWLGTKTELLFVGLILDLLHVGGRAAVIVPEGVLFGSTGAHRALRRKLVQENQLDAVISLSGGVFQPYTGVKTSILLFTKGGTTEKVWFYEVGADGYGLNARRTPQPEQSDLWDLVLHHRLRFGMQRPAFLDDVTWRLWQALPADERPQRYAKPRIVTELREADDASAQPSLFNEAEQVSVALCTGVEMVEQAEPKQWEATLTDLEANDYNLSAGRYKPLAASTKTYAPPADLIRTLQQIEGRIQTGLDRLLKMVEDAE